jgi:hypothetical protein
MAIVYADEVRQNLMSTKQRLKALVNALVDKEKERLRKRNLLDSLWTLGQRGPTLDQAPPSRDIARLDREIGTLKVEIGREQKGLDALQAKLTTAPKRPKTRSNVASIAASGSRAIKAASNASSLESAAVAWEDGIAAALHTAEKYGLKRIPVESLTIMGHRLADCYPGARLVQKDGPYPCIDPVARKRVVSK